MTARRLLHCLPKCGPPRHADFASGTVVALDGSRLARAEAAFALACYESLSAAGRGCG